jgi:excisionase family DNA binding protein
MMSTGRSPEIMTPNQAADYLQVGRETVYRYIRSGQLIASRLGRSYRIPKPNVDALLWATSTRPDIRLREFSDEQIADFEEADKLTGKAKEIAEQFDKFLDTTSAPSK